jgi:hypothetical protein
MVGIHPAGPRLFFIRSHFLARRLHTLLVLLLLLAMLLMHRVKLRLQRFCSLGIPRLDRLLDLAPQRLLFLPGRRGITLHLVLLRLESRLVRPDLLFPIRSRFGCGTF